MWYYKHLMYINCGIHYRLEITGNYNYDIYTWTRIVPSIDMRGKYKLVNKRHILKQLKELETAQFPTNGVFLKRCTPGHPNYGNYSSLDEFDV